MAITRVEAILASCDDCGKVLGYFPSVEAAVAAVQKVGGKVDFDCVKLPCCMDRPCHLVPGARCIGGKCPPRLTVNRG